MRTRLATNTLRATLGAALCMALSACTGDASQNKWQGSSGPLFDHPFAPVALRVHPLTHVDTAKAAGGASVIVLHLELRDRWGDSAKGVGRLTVLLYKPGTGIQPGLETQELKWDVPGFDDPNANMALYDAATRTYRVQLQAPDWVSTTIAGDGSTDSGWFTIRVVLSAGTDAEARYLSDEYVLQK